METQPFFTGLQKQTSRDLLLRCLQLLEAPAEDATVPHGPDSAGLQPATSLHLDLMEMFSMDPPPAAADDAWPESVASDEASTLGDSPSPPPRRRRRRPRRPMVSDLIDCPGVVSNNKAFILERKEERRMNEWMNE